MLFTCIKSWFFRNHLASFHQFSHWSFCWNVIDCLFKWSCSIDYQAYIFFFKTKNCSNDDIFISCDDRIGKMLHNISACLQWLCHSGERTVARGPLVCKIPACGWGWPWAGASVSYWHISSCCFFIIHISAITGQNSSIWGTILYHRITLHSVIPYPRVWPWSIS